MLKALWAKLKESMISVLPVVLLVIIVNFTPYVNLTSRELVAFLISAAFLIIGMALFNLGADLAMSPMGENVGVGLAKTGKLSILLAVCFALGVFITIAEPDLSVLASQVSAIMNGTTLIVVVGIGVGLFLVLGLIKIVKNKNLSMILMFFYMVLFTIAALVIEDGKDFLIPLSFDSGGVTTGPITVPFLMALGAGVAAVASKSDSGENSFGLIALCSVGPMLAVLILSLFSSGELSYELPNYSIDAHLGNNILLTILETAGDVALALALIVAFFIVLQIVVLKLPKKMLVRISIGIIYTFFGLLIFLSSVTIGFMPIGYKIGNELAGQNSFILIGICFLIGVLVVLAEPAVHVLNKQVEEITGGTVSKKSMMIALCVGVGISIALSIVRIIYNFSILYYLIPGYLISLGLSFFVPGIYTAIAFDSGGVASGPLTSSFILPLAIGACVTLQGEQGVLVSAFGVVAMVAMTPLITIQTLGFKAVALKIIRHRRQIKRIVSVDDEQIIRFKKLR